MSFDYKNLTRLHIRAARVVLDWDQEDLVKASGLSRATIQNAEKPEDKRKEQLTDRTLRDICHALEDAGIEFLNGDAPGVRLRAASPQAKD